MNVLHVCVCVGGVIKSFKQKSSGVARTRKMLLKTGYEFLRQWRLKDAKSPEGSPGERVRERKQWSSRGRTGKYG